MATERDAREGFRQVTNDENTPYHKFPKDYSLMLLGSFDERTGVTKLQEPQHVCFADDVLNKEND